ncbi:MAG: DUF5362 family protein [Phycisphaerales bacterium]|nr:DUF5362 family protein [Phycisphaerales bacterium]
MQQDNTNIFESGSLSDTAKAHLLETTRWTKFLAILSFIFIVLMLIGFIFMISASSMMPAANPRVGVAPWMITFVWLLLGLIYWYPSVMLYKFSNTMKDGLNTANNELVENAFRHQKNFWKFMGICTIVFIALYVVLIIVVVAGAAM